MELKRQPGLISRFSMYVLWSVYLDEMFKCCFFDTDAQISSELYVPFDDQINSLQLKNKPCLLAFFGDIAFL